MEIKVQCNGKINPVGVDCSDLCFAVWMDGINATNIEYEFYKEDKVKKGEFFHKEKAVGRFCHLSFDGFACGERLYYRAVVTTQNEKQYSEIFFAEQGLVEENRVGRWIGNSRFDGRVAEFSKKFFLEETPIKARLYIVGLGFYTSAINGTKTDEEYFKPLFTDFDERFQFKNNLEYGEENLFNEKKTVCYDTYDVTALLREGGNELRALLGTGWYCNTDKDHVDPSFTFGKPKLFFELHVQGKTTETIVCSNERCEVRNTAIRSQMFEGDFIDFTKEEEEFIFARECAAPTGKLIPALTANDKVLERLQPIDCKKLGNTYLYDFGKNHTGGLKLSVKGKRGEKLSIKYYEVLYPDGTPNPNTCRWTAYLNGETPVGHIDQQGEYVLSGGVDEIEPLFHWNCYRYAVVEISNGCEIFDLQSLFITTDMEEDSEFRCDWTILNGLHQAFILTQRDNMHCGVPSDCPHREKLPYTGDGHLVAEATMYALNSESFYRKWLKDIIASQAKNGWIPYSAPYMSGGGGYWWSNALPSVATTLYTMTGDRAILREALEPCLKLIDLYGSMHSGDYIIRRSPGEWLLGDWLAPDVVESNIAYLNTLAYYFAVASVKRFAKLLFKTSLEKRMGELLDRIAGAINAHFFDEKRLCYGNGVQGEDLLPIVYGIVPKEYEDALWKKVVAHYQEKPYIDTGIVLTPVLIDLLTLRGETKIVMDIMTSNEYPSYGYLLNGDTTLCEHWSKYWPKTSRVEGEEEVLEGDVSHCHPMYGSVVAWLYKHVGGLDLSEAYSGKIIFEPKFVEQVQRASASKRTAYGKASIQYDVYGGLKMKIKVPYGLEGEVRLPSKRYGEFSARSEDGRQVNSRRRGDVIYVKLSGGEWSITSENIF